MGENLLTFQYFWYIPLGLVLCACGAMLLGHLKSRNFEALKLFAGEALLPRLLEGFSLNRRRMKMWLLSAAVMAIFAALARPQRGFEWQEVNRRGLDILIAVDTSKSMLATDTVPNRLERAKIAVDDFIKKLDGDRAGLIPFAGTAFLMIPLTLDYDIVLDSLHVINTDVIPRPGTNISAAIDEARRAFSGSSREKILVIVSDGEDLEKDALQAASRAASDGVKIFTIGVGTAAGELIPVKGSMGNTGFVKDETGNVVKSRLDEETLSRIAETASASYFPLGQGGEGLQKVYLEKLKLLPKSEFAQRMTRKPVDRFEWALLAAFLALTLEFWLKERPSGGRNSLASVVSAGRRFLVRTPLLLVLFLPSCGPDAKKLYDQAEYSRASEEYRKLLEKDPENSTLHYNAGAADYKDGRFDTAEEQFESALKTEDLSIQEKAYFNLGDTFYRKGEASFKSDRNGTIESWKQAVESYENAVKLNPSNEDAVFNRDFVRKKLEDLMKQTPPRQKQQEQKKDQQQEQQEQGESEKQEQRQEQEKSDKQEEEQQQRQEQQEHEESGRRQEEVQQQSPMAPTPSPASKRREAMSVDEMTKEEARQLLESLRNEELKPPPDPQRKQRRRPDDDDVKKDW